MLRWISLAVMVIILTLAGTLVVQYAADSESEPSLPPSVPKTEGARPKFELVGQPVFNFGTMPKHTKGVHSWEVKNVGEGALEVWLDHTTCSCTVAKLESTGGKEGEAKKTVVVGPGRSTPIEVGWDTKGWNDFAHSATLETNDPEHPVFTLVIRGKVLAPVAVDPSPTIVVPTFSYEETQRAKFRIVSPNWAGLKLTKLSTSKPGLIVAAATPMTPEEAKRLKVQAGYHVSLEIKPGMPEGGFREELVIQTDHPDQPEVTATITGTVTGPISVAPQLLRMPYVTARDGASRVVILVVRGGRDTHFAVAHKPAKLEVAIARDDTPTIKGRYRMTVTVPPGTSRGLVDDRIVLKTDHPKIGELKIPVNINISGAGG
jgi:hypothetical protein